MGNDFSDWGESQSPNSEDMNFPWRIVRASHLRPTKFAVISVQHYGVYTHYWKGRTSPHLKHFCGACNDGMLPRWYGYVLALLSPGKEKIVFEFSAKACETILKAESDFGTLRGLVFTATRPKGKENSPVQLQLHSNNYNPAELPAPEPIRPIIARIWGFKESAAIAMHHENVRHAAEAQLRSQGFNPDRVSVREVQLNNAGEVVGAIESIGKLPSEDPVPSVNGSKPR